MKIRRYKGTSREELYQLIHKEMGPNAVVVAPETSGGGLLSRSRKYELIAILDEANEADPSAAKALPAGGASPLAADEINRWQRMQTRQWRELQSKMNQIQKTVDTLQSGGHGQGDPAPLPLPKHAQRWDSRFIDWARRERGGLLDEDLQNVRAILGDCLPIHGPFQFAGQKKKPHVIVLVGPTGSGKTTTLAKMAAICAHQERLRVGIVSIDTYRVAAVDQIREYASLLDMELRVAFSADEARSAIAELADNDVILVDTPGRTHFDEMGLAVSHKVLRGMGEMTVLLTIPATLSMADLADTLQGFKRFQPNCLVVTKVDETRQPVLFTALPYETDLKVAFVTNGQRVPQDIFAADAERVSALLTSTRPGTELTPKSLSPVPQGRAASAVVTDVDGAASSGGVS
jgi:flagellar biosynthesis protein FlhF